MFFRLQCVSCWTKWLLLKLPVSTAIFCICNVSIHFPQSVNSYFSNLQQTMSLKSNCHATWKQLNVSNDQTQSIVQPIIHINLQIAYLLI